MRIVSLRILRKWGILVAPLLLIGFAAVPAQAVTGAVTPILSVQSAGREGVDVTWGANMTGWQRGTLTLNVKFFAGGVLVNQENRSCSNCTSLPTPNITQFFFNPKAFEVEAEGCGPGGCETETKSA